MVTEIGDPTEATGKGAGRAVPGRTKREITTEAAQDTVAEEEVTLVEDRTEITAEEEVRTGVMVTTPTLLTSTDKECGMVVRTGRTEEIWHRENVLIGGTGE